MSSNSGSAQPSSTASESGAISDLLATLSATDSGPASATDSPSSASNSGSGSRSSAAASNTITDAPNLSSDSSAAISSLTGAPSLTSGDVPNLTDLPTLSGYYSYPPPSVPPTQNAPYMQRTNLPENFVFIIVGAVIAFVALVIVSWRILTSWSINRRFLRHEGPARPVYTPLADFKQKPPVQSSHDMKDLGNLPKSFSNVPSLFFSPTAEVARHSMRPPSSRHDSNQHLPAGHYRDASRS